MKSFTIHKLDAEAAARLEQRARQERDDFVEFFGTWTEEEATEFEEAVRVFDEIDAEGWK